MKLFTEKDYNSNNGMLTSVWGPSLWHALHCISVNYPVNPTSSQKKHYSTFIHSLRHVLPCKYCRINMVKNLKKVPLNADALKNRKNFSRWMYKFHEEVNKSLKKKSGLSFADVRKRYEHFRARCNKKLIVQAGGKEKGCTSPIYGVKSKCQIRIVPQNKTGNTLTVDTKCLKKRV